MGWAVWWALVFGFVISAVVPGMGSPPENRECPIGDGARPVAVATALGAASSSCSYVAVAIAKSLFQKGASAASALAFQFASTNLVWELGLVLWVLLGWQFTLAEYLGGIVMIVLMALGLRLMVSPSKEIREHQHIRRAPRVQRLSGDDEAVVGRLRQTEAARLWLIGATCRSRSATSRDGRCDVERQAMPWPWAW